MAAIEKHNLKQTECVDVSNLMSYLSQTQLVKQVERYSNNPDNNGELYQSNLFSNDERKKLSTLGYKSFSLKSNGKLISYYLLPDTILTDIQNTIIEAPKRTIKPIRAINESTDESRIFRSISKAAIALNCDKAGIARCLKGEGYYKSVKGYRFEYYADNK